ncbi:flagellar basal-body rod protein FlgB [Motilibacter rhizosphaerae]|uniref:Flagellar basal body rod protein FlgB n=1 Tax=Motilibacter rhizosphaerae TaxID=598652 RepID=A0A4Q7NVV9_9ACTN|nr:flagellar basal body rod protein FlgB [Motilibacter rhizosphaerae]RZS91413.1 flagellar basal-body rod protein FlgB [Motilibacter rhizosphaerae]
MFDDVTNVALRSALDGLAMRQRTTADNIANIQTPHFLAGKVQFEDALRQAVSDGDTAEVGGATGSIARSIEPTREDGNNVNLDEETLTAQKTQMSYSLMLRAVDDQFGVLKTSISG